MRHPVLLLALLSLLVAAPALAQAWQRNPDGARFARSGTPEVHVVLRAGGRGGACGGGGCTQGVEVRTVQGTLPSRDLAFYYSDRPGPSPGCFAGTQPAFLADWTELVVAPSRGSAEDRPSCGLAIMDGGTMTYWVVLRARRVSP
ncbi:MAG: hypothetical protein KC619_25620 [Myxococcales bacterium]|nr:hypothetical protein [Myxococcales bacterium]